MNFLGLPPELARPDAARYVVLPIPYDATTSYRGGTRLGPDAILDASAQVETFDQELFFDASSAGIFTAGPVHPSAAGPEEVIAQVADAARPFVRQGRFVLGLGGEHSVTTGLVRALLDGSGDSGGNAPFGVLQIDAHADLRGEYEGTRFSHACVMRRLHADLGLPISQVGIRSFCREEHDYMRAGGIELFTPSAIAADPGGWIGRALARLPEAVYVTIDVDGFDPAFAPGTGTPEPGGLSWAQATALLRAAAERKRIVGADLVEVAPIPGQHVTEFLAARLAYKLITYLESARQSR